MTQAELLTILGQKFTRVLTPIKGDREEDVVHWRVAVMDMVGDVLHREWIHFYVDDNDNAYWQGREPKIPKTTNFGMRVAVFVAGLIADGTIEAGEVRTANALSKTSIVDAIMEVTGKLSEVKLIFKEVNDVLTYKVMG